VTPWAKAQAKHHTTDAKVLGDQLHDAHIRLGANPGVFTYPDESTWDAISNLYGKQDQLEESLAMGVDQFIVQWIGLSLSDFTTTLENGIQIKVDSALAPLHVECAVMQRELQSTKAHLSSMEQQVAVSFPGPSFNRYLMMVVEFFAYHTSPYITTFSHYRGLY
jgi:hypothetical protein